MQTLMRKLVVIGQTMILQEVEIEDGRFFTEEEDLSRRRVAVIGADIPKELKTSSRALLNNELLINGVPYEVIGILKKEGSRGWESPDNEVYVPIMTASSRIFGTRNLRSINVKIPNNSSVEESMLYICLLYTSPSPRDS